MKRIAILVVGFCAWSLLFDKVQAGVCYPESGCTGMYSVNKTKAQCCSNGGGSFTPIDYQPDYLFQIVITGNRPHNCTLCSSNSLVNIFRGHLKKKKRCYNVKCGSDRKCEARFHGGKCLCRRPTRCRSQGTRFVCGTNGKTYRNKCFLLRYACRKQLDVKVGYLGQCKDNCKNVSCPHGQVCLVDQFNRSHCVSNCGSLPCFASKSNTRICGADGRTYRSHCDLRVATCRKGKTIGIAYPGACRAGASCSTVVCSSGTKCLTDETGNPRCASCRSNYCRDHATNATVPNNLRDPAGYSAGNWVCGSNGRNFRSYCALKIYSCRSGQYISIKHKGKCRQGGGRPRPFPSITDIGSGDDPFAYKNQQQSDARAQPKASKVLLFLEKLEFNATTLQDALQRLNFQVKFKQTRKKSNVKSLICKIAPPKARVVLKCK